MSRISSAISGIERRLLDSLAYADAQVALSNFRMATGHKINFPSDDPSTFYKLITLQTQLNSVTHTLANVTAAGSLVSQTQSGLDAITTQLGVIRTELIKDEDHSLTASERAESQATIDAAIEQINTLAGTSYGGKQTLSGAADYIYSGRDASEVADIVAHGSVPEGTTISGSLVSNATQAEISYTNGAGSVISVSGDTTFTLTGERGSISVTVTNGEAMSTVASYINQYSHDTGITASVDDGSHTLTFTSVDYGSGATADIAVVSGDTTFSVTGGKWVGNTTGTNASAEINGITISSSSNNVTGNRFQVGGNGYSFEIEFQPNAALGAFSTITVEGDALPFTLTESMVNKSVLAIQAVFAVNLGGPSGTLNDLYTGGSLSGLSTNTSQAIRVVDEALGKITRVDGSVDGFYDSAITSAYDLLSDMQTSLGDYIDSIDQVNDTEETANRDYYEALAANAVSGLTILNQQRMNIVHMLQDLAGLTQT
ncbi:MAG: flagellin N-terminal helical domain-containing protein [Thermoguttaceae bacterium]